MNFVIGCNYSNVTRTNSVDWRLTKIFRRLFYINLVTYNTLKQDGILFTNQDLEYSESGAYLQIS